MGKILKKRPLYSILEGKLKKLDQPLKIIKMEKKALNLNQVSAFVERSNELEELSWCVPLLAVIVVRN